MARLVGATQFREANRITRMKRVMTATR